MNPQTPSLLVIVPHAKPEACRRLQQTLDGSGIRVVVDRRSAERSSEPPREDRRTDSSRHTALAAGKWIVVPGEAEHLDVLDLDARAILFLYCSNHSVPCERCQETYRLGWVVRTERGLACPRCSADLTPIVIAHASRCPNWVHRRTNGIKPGARIDGHVPPRRTAAG